MAPDEVQCFLEHVCGVKNRAVLLTCYGSGLRISEAVALQIPDIDSKRLLIRVAHFAVYGVMTPGSNLDAGLYGIIQVAGDGKLYLGCSADGDFEAEVTAAIADRRLTAGG